MSVRDPSVIQKVTDGRVSVFQLISSYLEIEVIPCWESDSLDDKIQIQAKLITKTAQELFAKGSRLLEFVTSEPADGCSSTETDSMEGKIAVAYYGEECSIDERAAIAKHAGAIALVLIHNNPRVSQFTGIPDLLVPGGDEPEIPILAVPFEGGIHLGNLHPALATVNVVSKPHIVINLGATRNLVNVSSLINKARAILTGSMLVSSIEESVSNLNREFQGMQASDTKSALLFPEYEESN